ncbi:general secretion pathway protein M [Candidatus Photodesmus blepharus]|uniref:General secretion pathway protein M n=2 Tax=Candidatus Photodesmus blepharonis TaxID=1179155 RepID=A0A084CNK5_9GAMM|nr:general secretion pathway protein M [Candidatus Photodesmus blepharus]
MTIFSALFAIFIVYFGTCNLLNKRVHAAESRFSFEKELLTWVTKKANEINKLRIESGSINPTQSLSEVISFSACGHKVELIRIKPHGGMIQVWTKPIVFGEFVSWLNCLKQEYGVRVELLDIERSNRSGVIEVKHLQFSQG